MRHPDAEGEQLQQERYHLLQQLTDWLETLLLVLALYGFAVFGYFTATLATFFMGRDAENPQAEVVGAAAVAALHEEVRRLRAELRQRPFPTDSTASKQSNE